MGLDHFDLQIATRLADANAIVLAEAGEQHDALLEHAVPGVIVREVQLLTFRGGPFAKHRVAGVFPSKVGSQSLFKRATKEHGGPVVFLLPTVKIAIAIAPRAGQVLADLRVGVGHGRSTFRLRSR